MARRMALLMLLGLIAWAPPAVAQTAPDPRAVAAARQLLIAMGAEAQFDTVIKAMLSGLADQIRRQHPGHADVISDVFTRLGERFQARKGEALDMAAPLWAEKFSIAEMQEIAAFYRTPIGIKLLSVQPEIAQRSIRMGMDWGQRIGREVESEARRELKQRGLPI